MFIVFLALQNTQAFRINAQLASKGGGNNRGIGGFPQQAKSLPNDASHWTGFLRHRMNL